MCSKDAAIIITAGKTVQTKKPVSRVVLFATMPISHGPIEQPKSPQRANTLNISVPPFVKRRAAIEYVPGQERLTLKPHKAQAISDRAGILNKPTPI